MGNGVRYRLISRLPKCSPGCNCQRIALPSNSTGNSYANATGEKLRSLLRLRLKWLNSSEGAKGFGLFSPLTTSTSLVQSLEQVETEIGHYVQNAQGPSCFVCGQTGV